MDANSSEKTNSLQRNSSDDPKKSVIHSQELEVRMKKKKVSNVNLFLRLEKSESRLKTNKI